jgi:hypothetical protein
MAKDYEERSWGMNLEDWGTTITVDSTKEKPVKNSNKYNRTLTDADIIKYEPMVEKYIRDYVVKNWNEASSSKSKCDVSLGNTGMSIADIRQHLRTEVCVALYNYNPDYKTKEGRSVKESTFVFGHLFNRIGQMMKRLTKKRYGYGVWTQNLEETLWETDRD